VEGYNATGYISSNGTEVLTLVISEQIGRLFTGKLYEIGEGAEGFSGMVALDNKTFYIAEFDKGYDIGTVLSNDTIELLYLEDGKSGGAFY
jgi:hypothetical protein